MIDLEGKRQRVWSERQKADAQQGYPLRSDVSPEARARIMREVIGFARTPVAGNFLGDLLASRVQRVLGNDTHGHFHLWGNLESQARVASSDRFLDMLEVCVACLWEQRELWSDVQTIQSILADDLSAFRFRNVGTTKKPAFEIHHIDNAHLHREVVDRTFELTRDPMFASAQGDYAEAWKHYSKGDLDDAVVNAHKAFESAAKVVIKYVEPTSAPDQMQTNQLVPELVRLDVLPSKLNNMVGHLQQIFMSAGSLRNSAGTGHGALVPTSPEATVALMALRLSGTLVSFLAERRTQMTPKS